MINCLVIKMSVHQNIVIVCSAVYDLCVIQIQAVQLTIARINDT